LAKFDRSGLGPEGAPKKAFPAGQPEKTVIASKRLCHLFCFLARLVLFLAISGRTICAIAPPRVKHAAKKVIR
jgi:hypothetical protein